MKTENIKILNSNGEQLHARLELPASKMPRQFALFAHCFTCNSNLGVVRNISRELTNYGFAVLRFDFTGLGGSEGDFADTNFSHNVGDLRTVHEYLARQYQAPTLLVGHSLGGAAALMAAAQLESIRAVATIGAPAQPDHVSNLFHHGIDEIREKGQAEVSIGGRSFVLKKQFIDDLEQHKPKEYLKNFRKPLLILHSPQDNTVGIENAAEIYQSAMHPKSFVSLDGADHLLSRKKDSIYAARTIGTWAERYLIEEFSEPAAPLSTKGEQVVAHWFHENKFTTEVSNGRHTILADEPESFGGNDLGPSPYELLNAALGACTDLTLKLYAERKGWPLEEVYTYLTYSKKHIQDCEEGSGNQGKIDHIQKTIEIVGELSAEQKSKLVEIASKCPVHRTLTSDIVIDTDSL